MPRPDGRVTAGEPLNSAISARAYNRALDAADIVFRNQNTWGSSSSGWTAPYTYVYCQNSSGGVVPRWGIMRVNGIATATTGTEYEQPGESTPFETMPCLVGATPDSTENIIVIATGPIKDGETGKVAVAGVVQVRLKITSESHSFAKPRSGSRDRMDSADSGYPLLWKEPGTGNDKWALVSLAKGGSGSDGILSKTTELWALNTSQTLCKYTGPAGSEVATTETVIAWNKFAEVPEGRWVFLSKANNAWYMVAAECNPECCDSSPAPEPGTGGSGGSESPP